MVQIDTLNVTRPNELKSESIFSRRFLFLLLIFITSPGMGFKMSKYDQK